MCKSKFSNLYIAQQLIYFLTKPRKKFVAPALPNILNIAPTGWKI
jgi:hypothetical protein